MRESDRSFLRDMLTIGDNPLDTTTADSIITGWIADGIKVPYLLRASDIVTYHNDTLNNRYPVSWDQLPVPLDEKVYQYLHGIKYDFIDGLDEPITYVEAWYAVNEFRSDDEANGIDFPSAVTPLAFMQYINSHYAMRKRDAKLWTVCFSNGEENWFGPFRSLGFMYETADGYVHYSADDTVHPLHEIIMPKWHEIRTRSE